MIFCNLLGRIKSWLKKIFRIDQRPISENQREVPPEEKNYHNITNKAFETKTTEGDKIQIKQEEEQEVVQEREEVRSYSHLDQEHIKGTSEVSQEQEISPESPLKEPNEKISNRETVVEVTPETQKPNKKGIHLEPKEENRSTFSNLTTEKDLGKQKYSGGIKQQPHPKEESEKKTMNPEKGKETSVRIQSPYVELDLDEAKVFLVIPEQQFETNAESNITEELHYRLEINENIEDILAKVSAINLATVEEKRRELTQPLNKFKTTYPKVLQSRVYSYHHAKKTLYAFIAIGNNRGRMYYLFDKNGNMNPLPKKSVWILLEEGFEVPNVDIIEERWIWERYQPLNINLKNNEELIIRNRQTGKEEKIPCKPSFSIVCDALIEDDFKDISPLITGNWIKIIAPRENPSDWIVGVQNKQVGCKLIPKCWTGEKPLELKLPDDLPCECGEFQVDIFDKEDGNTIETLFFRYIPSLKLKFSKDLIIPDPRTGHKKETVKILFEKDSPDWELKNEDTITVENIKNGYKIELPRQQDVIHFSLMKKDKPETETSIRITIPRLKWRTSKCKSWSDRPIQIKREELFPGDDFCITVCTNDIDTQYDLLAILETASKKLQEAKFKQKGGYYNLFLNQFYDTIKENNDKISLRMEIRKIQDNEVLGQTEVIHLPEVAQEGPIDKLIIGPKVKGGNGKFRMGKGFSKKEVKEAGIILGCLKIKGRCIPVDKRRKSMYSENIEILKSLMRGK